MNSSMKVTLLCGCCLLFGAQIATARTNMLEYNFQVEARKVTKKDVTLFPREWSGKTPAPNTIRVCQFNVLAHTLASHTAGFANYYKDIAPIRKKLTDEKYNAKYRIPRNQSDILFGQCEDKKDQQTDPKTGYKYPIPERIKRALGVVLQECPDIITLQELDHWRYFEKVLGELGYEGRKELKTPKKNLHKYNGGYGPDGVAIFWNKKRFKLKYKGKQELTKVGKTGAIEEAGQRLMYVVLEHTNLLETGRECGGESEIAVVTGHFKSGKEEKDEVLKTSHVEELTKLLNVKLKGKPVIFACDFNTAHDTKPLQKFIEWNKDMKSAYPLGDKEKVSTIKLRKAGEQDHKVGDKIQSTIDYIFYSPHFKYRAHLELPTVKDVRAVTGKNGLPCWKFPSDHFNLVADFYLTPKSRAQRRREDKKKQKAIKKDQRAKQVQRNNRRRISTPRGSKPRRSRRLSSIEQLLEECYRHGYTPRDNMQ